jgi:ankyrin repeat protein
MPGAAMKGGTMPAESEASPRTLPERPNLRHLKDQAKAFLKAGSAASLSEAQLKTARTYGFSSWARLKKYVDEKNLDQEIIDLKQAIDTNDLDRVQLLMMHNPALHRAPIGYGKNGPLTWVAECRVPWEPPTPVRLATAQWMIDNGSDVHQGSDGPLMRAALRDDRIPMMELLVRNGADVNAEWDGFFPIIFAPCETLAPASLKWLIDHGANPDCARAGRKYPDSALDYVIGTYSRSEMLGECIDILLEAGCPTRHNIPAVLEILRGRIDRLRELLDADPSLVNRRFRELDFGSTAYRSLTLRGGTLLHAAAEYGNVEAAQLLLERGADVNGHAATDEAGGGGQTPIFHAVSQFFDFGCPMVEFLVKHGADLSVSARIPGHYERPAEVVECTPFAYAHRFPGGENKTTAFLRATGAPG